jgi:hypothetical protein
MAQTFSADNSAPALTLTTDVVRSLNAAQISSPATSPTTKRKLATQDQPEKALTHTKKKKYGTGIIKKSKRKECVTCCNQVPVSRFPKLPHKTAEKHGRDVCIDCWEQHLKSEMKSKGWDAICCPLCDDALDQTEIKKLAKDGTYGE